MEMKDGDVFTWSYKDGARTGSNIYHCKSRIAVCRHGYLYDTFWSSPEYFLDQNEIDLQFIVNQNDLEPLEKWRKDYYDRDDVFDFSHSNSWHGNLYVRKGAKKSPEVLRKAVYQKIADLKSSIESSKREIERLTKAAEMIDTSIDSVYI